MATASTMRVKGMDATYYNVKDVNGTTEFYTKLFGFAPQMHVAGHVSEWIFPGGEAFGLYQDAEGTVSGSGVMFSVDDVKAAVEACRAMGVKLEDGGEIVDTPDCFMAFAQDPEGNHFIIHKHK
jgi:predicted enzyme related to lactoylglutathione lyase